MPSEAQGEPARKMELPEARALYDEARARLNVSADHLVPDIALIGFLTEIDENVRAVEVVAASDLPHRAYPNARAAYEAAQRALLLVTAEDYDLEGAKAWVYYLRRDREYLRLPRSSIPAGGPPDPIAWFEGSLAEMERAWNDLAPGRGALLRRALAELPPVGARPDNWARVRIARTLRDRLNALLESRGKPSRGDTEPVYQAAYSGLTRLAHPGSRLDLVRISRAAGGQLRLEERPRNTDIDRRNVLLSAASSMAEGTLALTLRLEITKSESS